MFTMFMFLTTIFAFQWVFLNAQTGTSCSRNSNCTTVGMNPGRCVPISACKFKVHHVTYGKFHRWFDLPVCCPKLQSEPDCGTMSLQDHIYGGVETDPDEFPWTAFIYQIHSNTGEYTTCGGTLINDRYVVTAAHCVYRIVIVENAWLAVRLGAWDILNDENSTVDIAPESLFIHEGYAPVVRSREHDIALIKLSRPAPRSNFIQPICLPTQDDYTLDLNMPFFVTGWGLSEKDISENNTNTKPKLKVKLPAKNLTDCQRVYIKTGAIFTDNHLCVGGSSGKDSCAGDSGGPLMTEIDYKAYLIGIVSWGSSNCATAGVPAIYTRFDRYLDWVAAKIEGDIRY